jgi:hypothetical protein
MEALDEGSHFGFNARWDRAVEEPRPVVVLDQVRAFGAGGPAVAVVADGEHLVGIVKRMHGDPWSEVAPHRVGPLQNSQTMSRPSAKCSAAGCGCGSWSYSPGRWRYCASPVNDPLSAIGKTRFSGCEQTPHTIGTSPDGSIEPFMRRHR